MPTSKQTKLFVLLGPKNGLCSMHSIPGSDVFYFSEFRDDSTSSANRQQNWNALVMAQAVQKGNSGSRCLSAPSVHMLAAALNDKREEWLLKRLKEITEKAKPLFPLVSDYPQTNMSSKQVAR
jgi:hypothetical protein